MNLHEIDSRISFIVENRIDPETGEVFADNEFAVDADGTAKTLLDELQGERAEKIMYCAMYFKNHMMMAKGIKEEEQALAVRRRAHERDAQFLKGWIEESCLANEKFESPSVKVTFRKSTRIDIREWEAIPKDLIFQPPVPEPRLDKKACKEWIKTHHEPPPGVEEIPCKNMQVK